MRSSTHRGTLASVLVVLLLTACSEDTARVPVVDSVQLDRSEPLSLVPGGTHQLSARALDAGGTVISTTTFTWSSSDQDVATVTAQGNVTAVRAGAARITATASGQSAHVDVEVTAGGQVGAAGGTISTASGVSLMLPAGAVTTVTAITVEAAQDPVSSEHVLSNTVHEFGPAGLQFAQPVTLEMEYDTASIPAGTPHAALRIAKLVDGRWQPISEGASVDSVSGEVRATIQSFSKYAVVRDPCVPGVLSAGTVVGRLTDNDCYESAAERHSDYYTFGVPAGEVVSIESTAAFTGVVGIRASTSDPAAGTVWAARTVGSPIRLLSNGSPLQLYVAGSDAAQRGDYTVTRSLGSSAHACGSTMFMMAGTSVSNPLNGDNSCTVAIQFSPFPEAIGKPLWAHYHHARLEAGQRYTIRLTGLSSSFDPSLTVFTGGAVAAQSVATHIQVNQRTLVITPSTTAYYTIEVGSGKFVNGRWTNQMGTYSLSLTSSDGCVVQAYEIGTAVAGQWDAAGCSAGGRAAGLYEFRLTEPQEFRVDVEGPAGRTLYLRRKSDNYYVQLMVGTFAISPDVPSFPLKYKLPADTYILEVRAPAGTTTGDFAISSELDTGITCRPIVFGALDIEFSATIDPATDCRSPGTTEWYEDWLVLILKTGDRIRLTMSSDEMAPLLVWRDDREGPASPTLTTASSPTPGTVVIEWTATFDGFYEAVMTRANTSTGYGTYNMKVERIQ